MIDRRAFVLGGAALAATAMTGRTAHAGVADALRSALASECGDRRRAIEGTLRRMASVTPPGPGRCILVDIPSQHLAIYHDGVPVLESRVVVGDPDWRTPIMDTRATWVRLSPTWTVPESILRKRDWRGRLARDPGYFENLGFLVELGGRMVSPSEAAGRARSVGRFVQQPGPGNALGAMKIALAAGNAIYLHDTSDPAAFDETRRDLSHGCIRVERAMDVAADVMGVSVDRAWDMLEADDRSNHDPAGRTRVQTTYFTAWADDAGVPIFYPDVYGFDGGTGACPTGDAAHLPSHGAATSYDAPETLHVR